MRRGRRPGVREQPALPLSAPRREVVDAETWSSPQRRGGPRWSQNGHGNFGVTFVLRLSAEVIAVAAPRTGAERYFAEQKQDPEFRAAHEAAARRIRRIDELVRAIDARRVELGWTKAELARRAGMPPEAVRRLFSVVGPNTTAVSRWP